MLQKKDGQYFCHYDIGYVQKPRTTAERWEIACGAVLTQNTDWRNVVKALIALKINNKLSCRAILDTSQERLARLLRPAGYYNQKAKKLHFLASFFKKNTLQKAPTRSELLQLWGVGPETADSILLYAFNQPLFVVDAYTKRLSLRLQYFHQEKQAGYAQLQDFFSKQLPVEYRVYNELHALIVEHSKRFCAAKPRCELCPLKKGCAYGSSC